MNKKGIIFLIIAVILATVAIFLNQNQEITQKNNEKTIKTLKIDNITLNIAVANTETEREQGLSGKSELAENEGMLFIFDTEGYYGFWMKDMNFPIDMAWLDKNKKIIYIEKNVLPETFPKVFYALENNTPILNQYVLETKANFFEKSGIKIGDFAEF